MDAAPNLVTCDWCKCTVSKKKIEKHKISSCPKAPAEIIAARPKRPDNKSNYHSWLRAIEERIATRPDSPSTRFCFEVDPNPDRLSTTPSSQDRQINRKARIARYNETGNVFHVHDVLVKGGSYHHHLRAYCEYCHRTIEVDANGPWEMPKFAEEWACKLALLEHLRLDDARPYHSPAH
jgi:hypothetical protein